MKNLIYSLLSAILLFSNCADFDEFSSLDKKAAPDVTITTSAVGDSTFTLVVAPQEGTQYYSYVVKEEDAPNLPSAALLLAGNVKDAVAGGVLKYADNQTFTIVLEGLVQNTNYQIYAVAGNDQGITGEVSHIQVLTTDSYRPIIKKFAGEKNLLKLAFDELLERGEGRITIDYYFINEPKQVISVENPVDSIQVNGNEVNITLRDYPGVYACVSYEEGAFKDLQGQPCKKITSGVNDAGKFVNIYYRLDKVPFVVKEMTPEPGAFQKWDEFQVSFDFGRPVYKSRSATDEHVQAIYYTKGKKQIIDVPTGYWGVSKDDPDKLVVYLPESPEYGAYVDVILADGAVEDKAGNPSKAYTPEEEQNWIYSYGYEVGMVLRKYRFICEKTLSEEPVAFDIEVKQNPDPEAAENALLITGFFGFEDPIEAIFNGDNATISIPDSQVLGEIEGNFAVLWEYNGADFIVLNIAPDGSMTTASQIELGAYDPVAQKYLGSYEVCDGGTFSIIDINTPQPLSLQREIIQSPLRSNVSKKIK